jgi:hypothetical protein
MKLLQKTEAHEVIKRIGELIPEEWRSRPVRIRMGRSDLYTGSLNGEPDTNLFREGRAHFILQMLDRYIDVEPTQLTTNTDLVRLSITLGSTEIFRLGWFSQVEINVIWEMQHSQFPLPAAPVAVAESSLSKPPADRPHSSRIAEYAQAITMRMGQVNLMHNVKVNSFRYRDYLIYVTTDTVGIARNETMVFCSQRKTEQVVQCSMSNTDLECIHNLYVFAKCWSSYRSLFQNRLETIDL